MISVEKVNIMMLWYLLYDWVGTSPTTGAGQLCGLALCGHGIESWWYLRWSRWSEHSQRDGLWVDVAATSRGLDLALKLSVVPVVACICDQEVIAALLWLVVHPVEGIQWRLVDRYAVVIMFVCSWPVKCGVLAAAHQLRGKPAFQGHVLTFPGVFYLFRHCSRNWKAK